MKDYSNYPVPTHRPDDRELAEVLTAIYVVSHRLALKLTTASYQNDRRAEHECPLWHERRMYNRESL